MAEKRDLLSITDLSATENRRIIQRALEMNRSGKPVLLEFITKEEGDYSKFQWS